MGPDGINNRPQRGRFWDNPRGDELPCVLGTQGYASLLIHSIPRFLQIHSKNWSVPTIAILFLCAFGTFGPAEPISSCQRFQKLVQVAEPLDSDLAQRARFSMLE